MRVLFFICVVLAFSVSAQTPFLQKTFNEGAKSAREGQYEKAIEKYRAAIIYAENERADDYFVARIHFNIGVCFYHLKQTSKAVAEYTEAIKLSERSYRKAFYALGMAQKDLKNWREAENAFRDALKIEKKDGEAWFDLALVYLEKEDLAAAAKAFQSSIKYKSVNASDAQNNLGVIFALQNDWTSAEKHFENALLNSNGKSVEAGSNLRLCKFYKQNFDSVDLLAKLEFSRTKKERE